MTTGGRLTAVFLDRDGVINRKAVEGDYIKTWKEFSFLPRALEALRLLGNTSLQIVVVTNQRGIATGAMTEAAVSDIHDRMRFHVAEHGGRVDAVYHCPHAGGCQCRKPRPGMLLAAARDLPGLALRQSALVGDRADDMKAAAAVGATRVLVRGFEEPVPPVDHVAEDLLDAVTWLLGSFTVPK